jgi:hypothetical protein
MTITTISSIRVKPRWPAALVSFVRFTCLSLVAEEITCPALTKRAGLFPGFMEVITSRTGRSRCRPACILPYLSHHEIGNRVKK